MKGPVDILVVVRHPVGGIRTYFKYTYGSFNKNIYRFTFVTIKSPENDQIRKDLSAFDVDMWQAKGKKIELQLFKKVVQKLKSGKFALMHSHGYTAGVLAAVANIPFRLPHIVTSHDVFRMEEFPGLMGRLKRWAMFHLLKRADVIQSVGEDAQKNILEFMPGFKKKMDKLCVIRNGISVDRFRGDDACKQPPLYQELGLVKDVVLFGFLGRFMPQKGFNHVIQAVEELSKEPAYAEQFRVVAVNDGAFIREYKSVINRKNISNYFIFYGFSPNIERLLKNLDALLMPSLWEACSVVAMEALVAGCPLIATECIGLRELLMGSPALRIKMKDPISIKIAMKSVMAARGLHKKEALEFAPTAAEAFDARRTARQLQALYQRVLEQKGRGPKEKTLFYRGAQNPESIPEFVGKRECFLNNGK